MRRETVTAELRGLLRGALAANDRAREMARGLKLLHQEAMIVRASLSLLAAIAHIEDDATAVDSETKSAS